MKRMTAILLALLTMAVPAQAASVSAKVGPLLKEAQQMIAAKNYKGAMAKLNEAEAVKSWPDDATVINQFRQAIIVSSLDPKQPHCTSAGMEIRGAVRQGQDRITRCDGRAIGVQP